MKYLVLLVLSINTALACRLSIPESYVPTFLNPPVVGKYMSCEDAPAEKCHCVDSVNSWYAELVDNEVLDYISKLNETSCDSIEDCDAKFITSQCLTDYEKIKNYDLMQVYCVKNVMKIDGKKLVESPTKKAAYLAAQANAEGLSRQEVSDLKALIEELQSPTDVQATTTLAQLRPVIIDKHKKIGRILKFMMKQLKGE